MATLIFDIETVGEEFDLMDETTKDVLTRWIQKESREESEFETALEDLKAGLGFSPLTGEIIAIGVLDYEKDRGTVYFQAPDESIGEFSEANIVFKQTDEASMLEHFWNGVSHYQEFVSFNGRSFDAPFLMVRSAIHKIKPTKNLMSNRYLQSQFSDARHVDLLDQLSFYGAVRRKGNLHLWCRAFGIRSPKTEGITGDDVAQLFREKKYIDIAKYNAEDLRATRELYEYWKTYLC